MKVVRPAKRPILAQGYVSHVLIGWNGVEKLLTVVGRYKKRAAASSDLHVKSLIDCVYRPLDDR